MGNKVIKVYVGEDGACQSVTIPKSSDMLISQLKSIIVSTLHIDILPEQTSLTVLHSGGNTFQTNRNLTLAQCGIVNGTRVVLTLRVTPPSSRG